MQFWIVDNILKFDGDANKNIDPEESNEDAEGGNTKETHLNSNDSDMGDRELGVLQRKNSGNKNENNSVNDSSQHGEKDEKNKYLINNNEKK